MRIFTVDEANDLLPEIVPKLKRVRSCYSTVATFRESVKAAAVAAEEGGGGMERGSHYVRCLYQIGKLTTELSDLGVQLKDYSRGLIDFPAMRGEEVVLLCWQLGESEEIQWWHEIEGGFAGRRPI